MRTFVIVAWIAMDGPEEPLRGEALNESELIRLLDASGLKRYRTTRGVVVE